MASQQELDNLILQEITTLQVKTALSELQGKAILLHDPTTGSATAFDAYTLFNALGTISLQDISRRVAALEATTPTTVTRQGQGNVVTDLSIDGGAIVEQRQMRVVESENLTLAQYNSRLAAGTLDDGKIYLAYRDDSYDDIMRVCVGQTAILVRDSQSSFVPVTQQSVTVLDALPVDETLSKEGGVLGVVGSQDASEAIEKANRALTAVKGVGTWLSKSHTLAATVVDVPLDLRRPSFVVNYRPLQTIRFYAQVTEGASQDGIVGFTLTAPDGQETVFSTTVSSGDTATAIARRLYLSGISSGPSVGEQGQWTITPTAPTDRDRTIKMQISDATDYVQLTQLADSVVNLNLGDIVPYNGTLIMRFRYVRDIYSEPSWNDIGNWEMIDNGQWIKGL